MFRVWNGIVLAESSNRLHGIGWDVTLPPCSAIRWNHCRSFAWRLPPILALIMPPMAYTWIPMENPVVCQGFTGLRRKSLSESRGVCPGNSPDLPTGRSSAAGLQKRRSLQRTSGLIFSIRNLPGSVNDSVIEWPKIPA